MIDLPRAGAKLSLQMLRMGCSNLPSGCCCCPRCGSGWACRTAARTTTAPRFTTSTGGWPGIWTALPLGRYKVEAAYLRLDRHFGSSSALRYPSPKPSSSALASVLLSSFGPGHHHDLKTRTHNSPSWSLGRSQRLGIRTRMVRPCVFCRSHQSFQYS